MNYESIIFQYICLLKPYLKVCGQTLPSFEVKTKIKRLTRILMMIMAWLFSEPIMAQKPLGFTYSTPEVWLTNNPAMAGQYQPFLQATRVPTKVYVQISAVKQWFGHPVSVSPCLNIQGDVKDRHGWNTGLNHEKRGPLSLYTSHVQYRYGFDLDHRQHRRLHLGIGVQMYRSRLAAQDLVVREAQDPLLGSSYQAHATSNISTGAGVVYEWINHREVPDRRLWLGVTAYPRVSQIKMVASDSALLWGNRLHAFAAYRVERPSGLFFTPTLWLEATQRGKAGAGVQITTGITGFKGREADLVWISAGLQHHFTTTFGLGITFWDARMNMEAYFTKESLAWKGLRRSGLGLKMGWRL
jgi:Type IX secretion system membrane protein PorP/SprF